MSSLPEKLAAFRASGDASGIAALVPYVDWLGLSYEERDGHLLGKMAFSEIVVGNPVLPALHGGTLGALLESTAIAEIIWQHGSSVLPKTINITIDYLRSGRPVDTWAQARISKSGRRVVSVRAEAWQEDRDRLIATASAHFLVIANDE